MGDPRHVRPDEVEVLVARELRKAGLPLATIRSYDRASHSGPESEEFVVALVGAMRLGEDRDVLVEFRNEPRLVDAVVIRAFSARALPPRADAPRRLLAPAPLPATTVEAPVRVLISTAGFEAAAVHDAQTLGITLLRIADGGAAFLRSQWAMGDRPPAWVPEYMAESVDLSPTGDVRYGWGRAVMGGADARRLRSYPP